MKAASSPVNSAASLPSDKICLFVPCLRFLKNPDFEADLNVKVISTDRILKMRYGRIQKLSTQANQKMVSLDIHLYEGQLKMIQKLLEIAHNA